MEKDKFEVLKKIRLGRLPESELTDLYYKYRDNRLFLFNLIQNPAFPVRLGLEIIPKLLPVELVRVISNKRTNSFLRKKCEIEFFQKFRKIPLGEKISLLKFAPESMLEYFIEEKDERILRTIVSNPKCTENLIIKFVNRKEDKEKLYKILIETLWLKQKNVSVAISYDKEAPIRVWGEIINYIPLSRLKEISENKKLHKLVLRMISARIKESISNK